MRFKGLQAFKIAATVATAALSGSLALAQSGEPKVPPMPGEVAAAGDPDAVCVLASIDAHVRVDKGTKEKSNPDRDAYLESVMRQLAFYTGMLSAHGDEAATKAKMRQASTGYFDKTKLKDTTTAVMWCYEAYVAKGAALSARADRAAALSSEPASKALPPLKAEDLDRDAMCYALITHGIPSTQRAAKTNPDAARGVQDLQRTQHFYIGRLVAAADQAAVGTHLDEAFRFSSQLEAAHDGKTAGDLGMACLDTYHDTTAKVLSYDE